MKTILMYFKNGEAGYKPCLLHFLFVLVLACALSWVPADGKAAEMYNVLPPGQELTNQQEWYLVRDVCYEDAVRISTVVQFPEEQISYAGTSGLRRIVLFEKAIHQCDIMLAEQADTYQSWLEYTYQLIAERYDEFIERRSQLPDSSEGFDIWDPGSPELDAEHQM